MSEVIERDVQGEAIWIGQGGMKREEAMKLIPLVYRYDGRDDRLRDKEMVITRPDDVTYLCPRPKLDPVLLAEYQEVLTDVGDGIVYPMTKIAKRFFMKPKAYGFSAWIETSKNATQTFGYYKTFYWWEWERGEYLPF